MNDLNQECLELIRITKEHLTVCYKPHQMVLMSQEDHAHFLPTVQPTVSAPQVHKNNLKPWHLGPAKAPRLEESKSVNIRNMDQPALIQPQELTHGRTAKVSGCSFIETSLPILAPAIDFSDIRKILEDKLPPLCILDTLPVDDDAKKITQQHKVADNLPQVAVITFSAHPKISAFLYQITRAIRLRFDLSCDVLHAQKWESDQKWETLLENSRTRLIIGSDYGMHTLPNLMRHYKEASRKGRHYLMDKPLLLLSDMSLYMREPHLKASLWQALLTHLT